MSEAKPFCISKNEVWEAYKRVKANKGAAGVDDESIEDFERNLKDNLYKLWNRMSSGSYFPPPVRAKEIAKKSGGKRKLGIPTVADRIAQQVVKMKLEPELEPLFHADSYGYRPGKSALDAVGQARERCWRNDWVLDLDIKGFFDNLDQSTDAGSQETCQRSVGSPLYQALAESANARRGWAVDSTGEGHAARRSGHAPYTKGNFQFERTVAGWRERYPLLDLRRK